MGAKAATAAAEPDSGLDHFKHQHSKGRITPEQVASMYKKNRDLDENGMLIRSRVVRDSDEEFVFRMMIMGVGVILSLFIVAVIICIIFRTCIRKPIVAEDSVMMRSFVQSEVHRRSVLMSASSQIEGYRANKGMAAGRGAGGGGRFGYLETKSGENYEPKELELELV